MSKILRTLVTDTILFIPMCFIILPLRILKEFWSTKPEDYVYHLINTDVESILVQGVILMTVTLLFIYGEYYISKNWVIIISHTKLISIVIITVMINLGFYHAIIYLLSIVLAWYLYIIYAIVLVFVIRILQYWTITLVLYYVERGKVIRDTKYTEKDKYSFDWRHIRASSDCSLIYLLGLGLLINVLPVTPLTGVSIILIAISGVLMLFGVITLFLMTWAIYSDSLDN